ncbi:MAG: carbohydrate ABC transporter permease [Clostridium sp.]|uniref:carbohydrate ABC transporter permease n=1 Tax=Clostridium TaxID=1485 RepID=UPI0011587C58|nr:MULTISPECIES: carbohydrate ABC transporter permease [Clostridium]MBS5884440.1 carbohydrate ABC transporter permease [Clostridium sp.]MDU7147758.1 carbohydrate ABC transporter permease [Clostridium sp.]MDU7241649.1 carbohydrate ABC transporter permease [Clostridium sp.]
MSDKDILKSKVSQIAWSIIKYLSCILAAFIFILPIVTIFLASFKGYEEFYSSGKLSLPENMFNFSNYVTAFIDGGMLRGFMNTAFIMVISLAGTILLGAMVAFVLQRFEFKLKKAILLIYLLPMFLPMVTTQVATFQIISKLGLYNTIWAPIVLYLGADVMSIYIMMQFMESIPIANDEAAMLDGASYIYIFNRLIIPLLKPAIATIIILRGVAIYNDFYTPFLYAPSQELGTVATSLYKFIGPYGGQWNVIAAGVILIMIPTAIVFLLLQKYIYNGFTDGAVK